MMFMHMWSMLLYVICLLHVYVCFMSVTLGYMLFIAHLCNHMLAAKWWWDLGHSSAHCLEGWVLGVGMSTLGRKRFCTPRIGDPQVPMTLEHPRCGFAASG